MEGWRERNEGRKRGRAREGEREEERGRGREEGRELGLVHIHMLHSQQLKLPVRTNQWTFCTQGQRNFISR